MELTLGYALIALGFLFLLAELFIPSSGLLGVLALASLGIGVFLTFQYSATIGMATLIGVFVAVPIFISILLPFWPRTPIGRRLLLRTPEETVDDVSPAQKDLEPLRGRVGKTLSSLRPAGVVDIDGKRVDALTEGMMVDPGQWVRCVDVRAGKLIVRPVEKPAAPTSLENADFS